VLTPDNFATRAFIPLMCVSAKETFIMQTQYNRTPQSDASMIHCGGSPMRRFESLKNTAMQRVIDEEKIEIRS